ncbi:MAG: hypothetical protein AAGP08_02830 [Pseudomonadota bacterium]
MRTVHISVLVLWAIAFFGSFIAFYVTPADDFGLAAGWNKVGVFMVWQAIATVLAVMCLVFRWATDERRLRIWSVVPAASFALLVVGLGGLILWATAQGARPPPVTDTPPVAVPAPNALE